MSAIVLVGHGSRVPAANQEFLRFVALFRAATSLLVEPGFVELAEPTLPQALARAAESGAREVAVLPFVLFAAGHVKSDIPLHIQAARTRYPRVRFVQGAPIGLHSSVLEILSDRVR